MARPEKVRRGIVQSPARANQRPSTLALLLPSTLKVVTQRYDIVLAYWHRFTESLTEYQYY